MTRHKAEVKGKDLPPAHKVPYPPNGGKNKGSTTGNKSTQSPQQVLVSAYPTVPLLRLVLTLRWIPHSKLALVR